MVRRTLDEERQLPHNNHNPQAISPSAKLETDAKVISPISASLWEGLSLAFK